MAEQAIALCDWDGELADELSFRKGDIITIIAKGSASGFWEGELVDRETRTKRRGLFPNCMVSSNLSPNRAPMFCDQAMALYDYNPKDDLEMSMKRGDVLTILRQHPGSPGWWRGVNESDRVRRYGGSIVIRNKDGSSLDDIVELREQMSRIFPSNYVTSRIVLAVFPFNARASHELSLEVENVILVHRKWNDGWWEGTCDGQRGIFPSNYTTPNASTISPPFFCNRCKTVYPPSSIECRECIRNDQITQTMMVSLNDFVKGLSSSTKDGQLDLFAHVDVDPRCGRASLLTFSDTLDKPVAKPSS